MSHLHEYALGPDAEDKLRRLAKAAKIDPEILLEELISKKHEEWQGGGNRDLVSAYPSDPFTEF